MCCSRLCPPVGFTVIEKQWPHVDPTAPHQVHTGSDHNKATARPWKYTRLFFPGGFLWGLQVILWQNTGMGLWKEMFIVVL